MDKKFLAWGLVNLALCLSGLVCAIVSIVGGIETVSSVGLVLASLGLTSTMAMFLYDHHKTRPWRSGSAQYQRLKKTTYRMLKNDIYDEVRIRQSFYIAAEKCGVVQNIYAKDFELMKGVAEKCITKQKQSSSKK